MNACVRKENCHRLLRTVAPWQRCGVGQLLKKLGGVVGRCAQVATKQADKDALRTNSWPVIKDHDDIVGTIAVEFGVAQTEDVHNAFQFLQMIIDRATMCPSKTG